MPTTAPYGYTSSAAGLNVPNTAPVGTAPSSNAAPTTSYQTDATGAQLSSNGNYYRNGVQVSPTFNTPNGLAPSPTSGATLNANISTPTTDSNIIAPPAVITSQAAQDDLISKQQQVSQLNSDVQSQSQASQAASQPPQTTQPNQQTATNTTPQVPSLDDTINSLLSDLSDNTNQINNSANQSENGLLTQEDQNTIDQNNQYAQTAQQLQAIASGVYPLSAPEQALLTSTAAVFQQTIAAQQQANTAYTGQMTEAMASLGISTSAPTEAIGNVQAAISSGQSKIASLDAQMSQSLATLQQGFQKQDFDMVQSAWEDASKQFEDRQTELSSMLTTVQTEAKNQTDEIQTQTSTALNALIQSADFTYKQKQDAITNALAQSTLDEKTADDAQKNLIAEYTAGMTGDGNGSGNSLPTVDVTADGTPNSAQQTAFLSQFSPQVASLIKGIANYTISPTSLSTSKKQAMGGMTQAQIVALASQYNPSYDEKQYATRAATLKQFTSGTYSQNVNALNTAIGHLNDLVGNAAKLNNTSITPLNYVKNLTETTLGSGNVVGAETNINAAVGELATAFKKSGATDTEIKNLGTISANSSPAQIKAFISTASTLLGSRLDALNQTYQSSMGSAPAGGTFLSTSAQTALINLQSQGYDINVDNLDQTPVAQLKAFNDDSPDNAAALTQLEQAMPNATPQEVLDFLQSNGSI